MISHKYAVGDRVRLTLDRYAESSPWDIHTISRKLPAEGNVCQYRVKRVGDGQERTVSETQMEAVKAEGRASDAHFKALGAQHDLQRSRNSDARARAVSARTDRGGR
jgi:hypothetical protein